MATRGRKAHTPRKDQSEAIREFMDAMGLMGDDDAQPDETLIIEAQGRPRRYGDGDSDSDRDRLAELRRRAEDREERRRLNIHYGWDEGDPDDEPLQ